MTINLRRIGMYTISHNKKSSSFYQQVYLYFFDVAFVKKHEFLTNLNTTSG
jgi:hypothetical protein